jgi:hypothetical protein
MVEMAMRIQNKLRGQFFFFDIVKEYGIFRNVCHSRVYDDSIAFRIGYDVGVLGESIERELNNAEGCFHRFFVVFLSFWNDKGRTFWITFKRYFSTSWLV